VFSKVIACHNVCRKKMVLITFTTSVSSKVDAKGTHILLFKSMSIGTVSRPEHNVLEPIRNKVHYVNRKRLELTKNAVVTRRLGINCHSNASS